jgi:hypothetical protein
MVKLNGHNSKRFGPIRLRSSTTTPKVTTSMNNLTRLLHYDPTAGAPATLSPLYFISCLTRSAYLGAVSHALSSLCTFWSQSFVSLPNQQGDWHVMIRSVMKIIMSVSRRWSLALSCGMAPPPPFAPSRTRHACTLDARVPS